MVLYHPKQCVIVDESSTYHTHMEELVTAGPCVELAREKSLGEARDVENGSESVHTAHHQETYYTVDRVLILKPFLNDHMGSRNKTIEAKQKEGCKTKRPVFVGPKFFPERDDYAGGKEDDEN